MGNYYADIIQDKRTNKKYVCIYNEHITLDFIHIQLVYILYIHTHTYTHTHTHIYIYIYKVVA